MKSALRGGGGGGKLGRVGINLGARRHDGATVADVRRPCGNDGVIAGGLACLSNICAQTSTAAKGAGEEKENHPINPDPGFFFFLPISWSGLPRRVNFTDGCCPSVAAPRNNQCGIKRETEGSGGGDGGGVGCVRFERRCVYRAAASVSLTRSRLTLRHWPITGLSVTNYPAIQCGRHGGIWKA